jgi:lathosterol oxidase
MPLPDTYTFRFGEGQISGFLSGLFGCLALLAVLCFRFPGMLTFPEFEQRLDPVLLRQLLGGGIILALVLAVVNVCIGRWRELGYLGMAASVVALVLGGSTAHDDGSNACTWLPLGVDWFILDLLASALIFIPLERLFALRRDQAVLRAQWRLDLQYFALVHLLVSLILIVSTRTVSALCSWAVLAPVQTTVANLPLMLQLPLILLVADLAQYWSHRLMHTVPRLWRIHAIHHSSPAMDWLASSRLHLGEVLITRTVVLAPVFVLGFAPLAVQLYVVYIGLHAIFVHANVRFTFGFMRHVLVTPAFHHWHHSDDARAANTNFAVHLPILDRLFGTHFSPPEWPASYGIGAERLPENIFGQLAYPLAPMRPPET